MTRILTLEIDGREVEVDEGQTILAGLPQLGIDTPTLCYADTLRPATPAASASSSSRAPGHLVRPARAAPRTG